MPPPLVFRIVDVCEQVSQSRNMPVVIIEYVSRFNLYSQTLTFPCQITRNKPGHSPVYMAGIMNNDAGQPEHTCRNMARGYTKDSCIRIYARTFLLRYLSDLGQSDDRIRIPLRSPVLQQIKCFIYQENKGL